MRSILVFVAWSGLVYFAGRASAGVLVGKIEFPAKLPDRAPPKTKAFLDRIENPFLPVRPESLAQQMVVIAESEAKPSAPAQVVWDLVGESFAPLVIAVPVGAEVVIKNQSRTSRTLVAAEDPKLLPLGPMNPTATKSFRAAEADKVFTIGDKDAPHLVGRVVVVRSQHIAYPDEAGRFEMADIPAGNYKVKVWYRTGWAHRSDQPVSIVAKGKTELNPRLRTDLFTAPAAK